MNDSPAELEEDYSCRSPLGGMDQDGLDLKCTVHYPASSASDRLTQHDLVLDGRGSIWR